MQTKNHSGSNVEIVAAPSSLGLTNQGVERLAETLLSCGLSEKLHCKYPLVKMPTRNHLRSNEREHDTKCLNANPILEFSSELARTVSVVHQRNNFALVLGGDCSILLGVMLSLKHAGNYGLVFIDAHADFYSPEKSTTGEVADMDLAIVTGRGPQILTDIDGQKPYVKDQNVVHIGQRDEAQADEFNSPDIRNTAIQCHSLQKIRELGIERIVSDTLKYLGGLSIDGFWIHFDTDVLADEINPAVDYRLPGGLQFNEATSLLNSLLKSGRAVGMSVTIYNPDLDPAGTTGANITECLVNAFSQTKFQN